MSAQLTALQNAALQEAISYGELETHAGEYSALNFNKAQLNAAVEKGFIVVTDKFYARRMKLTGKGREYAIAQGWIAAPASEAQTMNKAATPANAKKTFKRGEKVYFQINEGWGWHTGYYILQRKGVALVDTSAEVGLDEGEKREKIALWHLMTEAEYVAMRENEPGFEWIPATMDKAAASDIIDSEPVAAPAAQDDGDTILTLSGKQVRRAMALAEALGLHRETFLGEVDDEDIVEHITDLRAKLALATQALESVLATPELSASQVLNINYGIGYNAALQHIRNKVVGVVIQLNVK